MPLQVAKKVLTISTRLALWTILPLGSNVDDFIVGVTMVGRRVGDVGAAAFNYPKYETFFRF